MSSKVLLFILAGVFFALAIVPENLYANDFQKHFDIAKRQLAKGDFEHAVAEYQEALKSKPDSAIAQSWLGISYDRSGDFLLKAGDTDRAIEAYKNAVATLPDDPYWHEQLGLAFEKKGDRESAIKEFQTAATLSPLDDGLKAKAQASASGLPDSEVDTTGVAEVGKRVGSGKSPVTAPIPIRKPEPKYSERAREAQLEGTVVLLIVIDAAGRVSQSGVNSPLGLGLDTAALEAVRGWTFHPALSDGVPVAVKVIVEVTFRLH